MGFSVSTLKHAAKEKKATEAKSPKTTPAAAAKKESAAVEAAKKKAAAARMRATEEAAAAVRAPAPSPEPTPATGAEETDAILRAEAVAAAKEERLLRRSRGGPTGGAGGAAETGEPGTKRTREEGRLYYREFEAAMGLLEWCGRFVHGGGLLCHQPQAFLGYLRRRRKRRAYWVPRGVCEPFTQVRTCLEGGQARPFIADAVWWHAGEHLGELGNRGWLVRVLRAVGAGDSGRVRDRGSSVGGRRSARDGGGGGGRPRGGRR